jgi:hypothetical protein
MAVCYPAAMPEAQAAAPAAVSSRPDRTKRVPGFVRDLDTMIRARYPLIYLVSWEEQRLDVILEDLARSHGRTLFAWSITQGLRKVDGARPIPPIDGTKGAIEVLTHIRNR